jgi:hypothetical protein
MMTAVIDYRNRMGRGAGRRAAVNGAGLLGAVVVTAVALPAIEFLRFGPRSRMRRVQRQQKAGGWCRACGWGLRAHAAGRAMSGVRGGPVSARFTR